MPAHLLNVGCSAWKGEVCKDLAQSGMVNEDFFVFVKFLRLMHHVVTVFETCLDGHTGAFSCTFKITYASCLA